MNCLCMHERHNLVVEKCKTEWVSSGKRSLFFLSVLFLWLKVLFMAHVAKSSQIGGRLVKIANFK